MTPIGHTLTGLAICYLAIPRATPREQKLAALGVFAFLANVPDLPFPYWGHTRYDISHSVVVTTLGVSAMVLFCLWKFEGRFPFSARMLVGGALAWYSHLLLDTFYNHGLGLGIYWPLSDGRLALPIPWLARADREHIFSFHNVQVAVFELLTFGPLLAFSLLAKKCFIPLEPLEEAPAASAAD